jgi:uncharacterized protein YecE (DUF72 family)
MFLSFATPEMARQANPKNTANARVTASIVASSRRPNGSPTFSRGTVCALSTITCERLRRPLPSFGSIVIRNNGVSRSSLVTGPAAVEFRGGGWMETDRQCRTLKLLEDLGLAYVSVDEPQGFPSSTPPVAACTADLAVLRLHGHNAETWEKPNITAAERFRYLYSEDELRGWVEPVRALADQAERAPVLMNNCYRDYAVRNARQLAGLLAQPRAESAPGATSPASSQ